MILREHKVVAMAVDNVLNMDAATKKLKIMKCGCFTTHLASRQHLHNRHIFKVAPKISVINSVSD